MNHGSTLPVSTTPTTPSLRGVGFWELFLGKLKRPHPTSPEMVVYLGNSTKMALHWERIFCS